MTELTPREILDAIERGLEKTARCLKKGTAPARAPITGTDCERLSDAKQDETAPTPRRKPRGITE